MTTVKDTLDEDEMDDVEAAKLQSKREKTKYGGQITNDDD